MLPESIPCLKGKEAKEFEKAVARPTDKKTIELFRKARDVYEGIRQA